MYPIFARENLPIEMTVTVAVPKIIVSQPLRSSLPLQISFTSMRFIIMVLDGNPSARSGEYYYK